MVVPDRIRANLAAREIDSHDVLRTLHIPLLVSHGYADTVTPPAMADYMLATCPGGRALLVRRRRPHATPGAAERS